MEQTTSDSTTDWLDCFRCVKTRLLKAQSSLALNVDSCFPPHCKLRRSGARLLLLLTVCASFVVLFYTCSPSRTINDTVSRSFSHFSDEKYSSRAKNASIFEFHRFEKAFSQQQTIQVIRRTSNESMEMDDDSIQPPNCTLAVYPLSAFKSDSQLFSIIILSFNRSDLLLRLLNHYSAVANLEQIIVVWNDASQRPPVEDWHELMPHPVPTKFIIQSENKLRNRFNAFTEINTSAVLLLDDDILASSQDVAFAFRTWQRFPHLIVGFYPRKHVRSASGVYTYGSDELDTGTILGSYVYSMVLTGAAFVHKKYLEMFSDSAVLPHGVHRMIDLANNCEDIAMNVMVTHYLTSVDKPQCSGLYVRPKLLKNLESNSELPGLWLKSDHLAVRSHCLNQLAALYNGSLPLHYSDVTVTSLQRYY